MRSHLIFNEYYNKTKKLQIQRHVELQAVILMRKKVFMFVISNIVFMRCVLINAIINADTNIWHVLLYNVCALALSIYYEHFRKQKCLKTRDGMFGIDIL